MKRLLSPCFQRIETLSTVYIESDLRAARALSGTNTNKRYGRWSIFVYVLHWCTLVYMYVLFQIEARQCRYRCPSDSHQSTPTIQSKVYHYSGIGNRGLRFSTDDSRVSLDHSQITWYTRTHCFIHLARLDWFILYTCAYTKKNL